MCQREAGGIRPAPWANNRGVQGAYPPSASVLTKGPPLLPGLMEARRSELRSVMNMRIDRVGLDGPVERTHHTFADCGSTAKAQGVAYRDHVLPDLRDLRTHCRAVPAARHHASILDNCGATVRKSPPTGTASKALPSSRVTMIRSVASTTMEVRAEHCPARRG